MFKMLQKAKAAKSEVAKLSSQQKNAALGAMADALLSAQEDILSANRSDCDTAQASISPVMLDRLRLNKSRIAAMAQGIRDVAALPDPVGQILQTTTREDGLVIEKTAVPLGVIAIIYESRPNVTSDAAALTLKSGNVCVLRSGKEAFRSANAIVGALRDGLRQAGVTEDAIHLVQDTTRESANALMTANDYIDLLIPRGGAGLICACVKQATVPCIATGTGICHIYVEKTADLNMALSVIENAKTSRPSVCNAMESLIVHKDVAERFLPALYEELVVKRENNNPVELRLDARAQAIIPGTKATDKDFDTEFLDYILAVSVADDVNDALMHIRAHSTGHSEAIVTENKETADKFVNGAGSAAVYVNASTRFTDGGEFGLGCEMGISTQKLHARGPMGLSEMTSYQYRIYGDGQIR